MTTQNIHRSINKRGKLKTDEILRPIRGENRQMSVSTREKCKTDKLYHQQEGRSQNGKLLGYTQRRNRTDKWYNKRGKFITDKW